MSEDARKDCRTQGKYSDRSQYYDDRRPQKRQDKRQKVSPSVKEPLERKIHKRKSDGGKESNTSLSSESESPVRYQENSDHSFSQLEDVKRPVEIKDPGKQILSSTENGESVIFYDPYFFEKDEASELMSRLRDSTNWYEKNIVIHGVEYPQPRLVAWYGPYPYSYSGATLEPSEMPDCVLEIKGKVEEYLRKNGINVELNSVLLNLYRHNKDSVSWHSDDEMSMGVCPTIASVSLGETRRFEMRRKLKLHEEGSSYTKGDEFFVHLRNGSLLIMDGCMQTDWQHRVPKEYHDRSERINLTFRTVYEREDLPPSPGTYSKNQPVDNALKKSRRSKTDYGVNYDVENFPPLNSDSSPVCSDNAKKSQDSCTPKVTKSTSEFSGSHKRWDNENSSYNKTPLKSNNEITGTEEIWDSQSSPCSKTSSKTHDKLCKSGKKWDSRFTNNKTLSKVHDKYLLRGSGPNEIDDSESSSHNKTFLKNDDKINGSGGSWDSESSHNKTSLKNDDKINESGGSWDSESPSHNKTSLKNDGKISGFWDSESSSHNKTSLKNDDKINESGGLWDNEYSSCNENFLQTDAKISGSSKWANAGGFWDSESSSCNENFLQTDAKVNESNKGANEPSNNKKSALLNNLNEDKKNAKIDMQNKNLRAYGSNFTSNNVVNGTANARKHKSFNSKESHNVPTNSPDNNMQENTYKVKTEHTSSKDSRWTPNVEAKEFVPINKRNIFGEGNTYAAFGLENLLNYNVDVMSCESLKDYAVAVKNRVLEKMQDFRHSDQEQLEFLCEITDGNQTDRNQKLITARMLFIVEKAFKCQTSPNYRKSYGIPRKPNHGNQNHYSERRYQGNSRESHHRY